MRRDSIRDSTSARLVVILDSKKPPGVSLSTVPPSRHRIATPRSAQAAISASVAAASLPNLSMRVTTISLIAFLDTNSRISM
jgi:hypothetical protein